MQSYQSRETLRQKGEIMDKDQIKGIIMDLRSKGLSFQKIANILRESYSVDLTRQTIRRYFNETAKASNDKAEVNDESQVREIAPTSEVQPGIKSGPSTAQVSIENKQEQNKETVQPIHKVRYPGFEDEDLRKGPYYHMMSSGYLEMTPEQRYRQHLESVKQARKERNKSIAYLALFILFLLGLFFAFKYRLI
jgi:intein-encoded DNA endonuclease-like protein